MHKCLKRTKSHCSLWESTHWFKIKAYKGKQKLGQSLRHIWDTSRKEGKSSSLKQSWVFNTTTPTLSSPAPFSITPIIAISKHHCLIQQIIPSLKNWPTNCIYKNKLVFLTSKHLLPMFINVILWIVTLKKVKFTDIINKIYYISKDYKTRMWANIKGLFQFRLCRSQSPLLC